MYMNVSNCHICGQEIPVDRREAGLAVCTCGWVDNRGTCEKWERAASQKIATFGITAVGVILPILLYLVSWSGFGLEVLALEAKGLMGARTSADLIRKGEICEMLKKNECASKNYTRVIRTDSQNQAGYIKLANLHLRAKNELATIQVYEAFFQSGGKDSNLMFRMANLMANNGQHEKAIQTYEALMSSEPSILHITVAKSYVQLLIKLERLDAAKKVVSEFQSKGDNAKDYLNEELLQIEAGLKLNKTAARKI